MRKKNYEVQSRRDFFKKAAKTALPILGIAIFGPSLLTSCDPDDDDSGGSSSCNGCSGSCDYSCSGSCEEDCTDVCAYGCSGTCEGHSRSW